jgi:hypothetical protein
MPQLLPGLTGSLLPYTAKRHDCVTKSGIPTQLQGPLATFRKHAMHHLPLGQLHDSLAQVGVHLPDAGLGIDGIVAVPASIASCFVISPWVWLTAATSAVPASFASSCFAISTWVWLTATTSAVPASFTNCFAISPWVWLTSATWPRAEPLSHVPSNTSAIFTASAHPT